MERMQRASLIETIAKKLEKEKSFYQITNVFHSFGLTEEYLSQIDYSTLENLTFRLLQRLSDDEVLEIATDYNIDTISAGAEPPKVWEGASSVRAFISHLAKDKLIADELKGTLSQHGIVAFVAHESIKTSAEWQKEIKKALQTMDFFVSLHTKGFKKSMWCQQEIGFAVARNVKVIPIKFDEKENPTGFIGKLHTDIRTSTDLKKITEEIITALLDDEKTKNLNFTKPNETPDIIPF